MKKEQISPNDIFVGNLCEEIAESSLKEYCGTFGTLSKCQIMRDPKSGRSRRFGFLNFLDPNCGNKFLSTQPHYIGNRHLATKATKGCDNPNSINYLPPSRRIFVCCTSLKSENPIPELKIFEYLNIFGPVKGVVHNYTSVSLSLINSYWIVEFSDKDAVERCLAKSEHTLGNNVRLQIKKVLSTEDSMRRKRELDQAETETNKAQSNNDSVDTFQNTLCFQENTMESAREYVAAPMSLNGYGYNNAKRFKYE